MQPEVRGIRCAGQALEALHDMPQGGEERQE